MFKRLRIAVLLYVLAFVAAAQFFMAAHTKDWDAPLWVDVYAVDGDGSEATQRYLASLDAEGFDGVEAFFAREAHRYGVPLAEPFRVRVVGRLLDELPRLAPNPGRLEVIVWSLRMRWLAATLRWRREGPAGDILVLAVYHAPTHDLPLDRSTALEKGLVAIANLFADRQAHSTNEVVLAHELLHTLGATDKYSFADNLPRYPEGYAAPDARPLHPQAKAELMAGRRAISATAADMPPNLAAVVVGPLTAAEIGW